MPGHPVCLRDLDDCIPEETAEALDEPDDPSEPAFSFFFGGANSDSLICLTASPWRAIVTGIVSLSLAGRRHWLSLQAWYATRTTNSSLRPPADAGTSSSPTSETFPVY